MNGAFVDALFDPAAPVPAGFVHPQGGAAAARFAVYRNNVMFGLMQTLRDGFPLLHALLGDAAFDGLADAYARAEPPRDPLMFAYGETLPRFLVGFPPLSFLPYAADVAKMEVAMRQAARAADHVSPPPETLRLTDAARQGLALAPAVHAVASQWPLHDLFLYLSGAADAPADMAAPQEVLVCRRADYANEMLLLPAGGAAFVQALQQGQSLSASAAGLSEAAMTGVLTLLIGAGQVLAVIDQDIEPEPRSATRKEA